MITNTFLSPICSIERCSEVSADESTAVSGTFFLIQTDDGFVLQWTTIPILSYFHQMDNVTISKIDEWKCCTQFVIQCSEIKLLSFTESPLSINIMRNGSNEVRKFEIPKNEFLNLAIMVESLLKYGIAVPSIEEEFSLSFYKSCNMEIFKYQPSHIHIENISSFMKADEIRFDAFWLNVIKYFERLMACLDETDKIQTSIISYPFKMVVLKSHNIILNEINMFRSNMKKYETITEKDLESSFDEDGRFINPNEFKERVYHCGIEKNVLTKFLSFVFGEHKMDSTKKERDLIDAENESEFYIIQKQVDNILDEQVENKRKLFETYRIIHHDVLRTDRNLNAFKDMDKPGPKMLTALLKTYNLYNPKIGYLQGMNDLFVPIIHAYIPNWSENGEPIDENGNIIEIEKIVPKVFWNFESMIKNTGHYELLTNFTECCKKHSKLILKMIYKISPLLGIWMKLHGLTDLMWCFSDMVLIFKRSVPDVWPLWLSINVSPCPSKWVIYEMCSILIIGFNILIEKTDEKSSIQSIMGEKSFQDIIEKIDVKMIIDTSLWLYKKFPISEVKEEESIEERKFEFFDADCIKSSK